MIETAHLLDGLPDPRKPAGSQAHTVLDKRITRQLKTYGLKDSPVRQEKAIPLGIGHSIVAAAATSEEPVGITIFSGFLTKILNTTTQL